MTHKRALLDTNEVIILYPVGEIFLAWSRGTELRGAEGWVWVSLKRAWPCACYNKEQKALPQGDGLSLYFPSLSVEEGVGTRVSWQQVEHNEKDNHKGSHSPL